MIAAIGIVLLIVAGQAALVWRVHRLHLTPSKIATPADMLGPQEWRRHLAARAEELGAMRGQS